jgi:hypothetical protein
MKLCKLRLRGRFHNYSIFSAHAPPEEKYATEKDTFYDMLEKEYEKCPKHDIKIILGDFNAKIGQEEKLTPVTGMNSLHKESNDNGMILISYAASIYMVIGSTLFPHKNIYKASWKLPDGRTTNQIDHVLTDRSHKSCLQDVRSYGGANIDFLIIAKIWSRINKQYITPRTTGRKIYDIKKLNDPEVVTKYMNSLKSQIEINKNALELDNGNWTICKQITGTSAVVVIKEEGKRKRIEWFDKECEEATLKNSAHKEMIQRHYTRKAVENYKVRREEKTIHKKE